MATNGSGFILIAGLALAWLLLGRGGRGDGTDIEDEPAVVFQGTQGGDLWGQVGQFVERAVDAATFPGPQPSTPPTSSLLWQLGVVATPADFGYVPTTSAVTSVTGQVTTTPRTLFKALPADVYTSMQATGRIVGGPVAPGLSIESSRRLVGQQGVGNLTGAQQKFINTWTSGGQPQSLDVSDIPTSAADYRRLGFSDAELASLGMA